MTTDTTTRTETNEMTMLCKTLREGRLTLSPHRPRRAVGAMYNIRHRAPAGASQARIGECIKNEYRMINECKTLESAQQYASSAPRFPARPSSSSWVPPAGVPVFLSFSSGVL